MGLDLYHVIPSAKIDESFDYFTIDELGENPGFLYKHQHLIAEVEDFEQDLEILVFPDLATKILVLEKQKSYSEMPNLIGEIAFLQAQINQIAIDNSFPDKEPAIMKIVDNLFAKDTLREVSYHSISFESAPKTIKVLFYSEKGHQRKGMSSNFYNDFANNKLYFDKESVVKAYSYLDPTGGGSKADLQQYFKGNFVDNFIEGESVFLVSW
jgi:hypothetical protein